VDPEIAAQRRSGSHSREPAINDCRIVPAFSNLSADTQSPGQASFHIELRADTPNEFRPFKEQRATPGAGWIRTPGAASASMDGIAPGFGVLFGPTKSIRAGENLFAWDSALVRSLRFASFATMRPPSRRAPASSLSAPVGVNKAAFGPPSIRYRERYGSSHVARAKRPTEASWRTAKTCSPKNRIRLS
jgi:hypothetical protein